MQRYNNSREMQNKTTIFAIFYKKPKIFFGISEKSCTFAPAKRDLR